VQQVGVVDLAVDQLKRGRGFCEHLS